MSVTLEKIIANISSMFTEPVQPSVEYKQAQTSDAALKEVERLENLGRLYQSTYHDEHDKLRAVTFNQLSTSSVDVSTLNHAISNLQALQELIPQANKHYTELLMQENGVEQREDIVTNIESLGDQRHALSKQWFGPWRFSSEIKRINNDIDKQWELWSQSERRPKMPSRIRETVNDISAHQINFYVINRIADEWNIKLRDVSLYQTDNRLSDKQNKVARDVHNILARKKQEKIVESAHDCVEKIASLDKSLDRVRQYQKFEATIDEIDMTNFDFDTFETLPSEYKDETTVIEQLTQQFLTTPEHTNNSQILGRKFRQFKDNKAVLYNTLNFWRESGMSGERPCLQGYSKDSTAQAYLKSLDFHDQTKDVQAIIQELQTSSDHHTETIKSALRNIALDMLSNGSKNEQYFALNTIAQFDHLDKPLVAAAKHVLGINRELDDTKLLQRVLSKMTRNTNDMSLYAGAVEDMFDYNEEIQQIMNRSDNPDLLDKITRTLLDEYSTINNVKKQAKNIDVFKAINDISHLFTSDTMQDIRQKLRTVYHGNQDLSDTIKTSLINFHEIVQMSNEFDHPELQNVIRSCIINEDIDDPDQIRSYMNIISKPNISTRFNVLSLQRQHIIRNTAETAYSINQQFSDHFTENMILREKSMAKLWLLNRSLSELKNYHNLENHIVNNQTANEAYKTVTMFGLVRPTIDHMCKQEIDTIFNHDNDPVNEYKRLKQLQGFTPKQKSVQKLQKLVDQASKFEKEDNKVAQQRYQERVRTINQKLNRERTMLVHAALENTVYRNMENIVGQPVDLEITEDIINATLLYNDISKNKTLLQDMLKAVVNNTYDPYKDEKSVAYIDSLRKKDINVDVWTMGITKTYSPKLVQNIEQKILSEITHHTNEAHTILSRYNIEHETLEEGYNVLKTMNVNHDDVRDLQTQLKALKGLDNRNGCQNYSDVTIHLEQDPLKILQMGNYSSNSCLGLGKGNAWSTVANAVDCNKQVLYATMNGQIIGRKLIAINTDNELVQYRTYTDNIDLDLDSMFNDYLTTFAEKVSIKRGTKGRVETIVADHWYDDGIIS